MNKGGTLARHGLRPTAARSPRPPSPGCRSTCAASLEGQHAGLTTISSERLAELAGVNAAKVRKDLSYLGSYGTRGVGYDVEYLLFQMSRELGPHPGLAGRHRRPRQPRAGAGQLRRLRRAGLPDRGAVRRRPRRSSAPRCTASSCARSTTCPTSPRSASIAIGIIATPASAAQDVADRLVAAGVPSILNFAPTVISVPDEVSLRKVDLAVELQILSFYQQRKAGGPPVAVAD